MATQYEDQITQVFCSFADFLNVRFKEKILTTEDSIRYTFFAALLGTGLRPEEIILEAPHPIIERAQIDTFVPSFADQKLAIEFKYDRELSGPSNRPRPHQAGALFKDIRRLVSIPTAEATKRMLVYVTDNEMTKYMSNLSNGLEEFFYLLPGHALDVGTEFVESKSSTFKKAVAGELQAKLISLYSKDLYGDHKLRIYEIVTL